MGPYPGRSDVIQDTQDSQIETKVFTPTQCPAYGVAAGSGWWKSDAAPCRVPSRGGCSKPCRVMRRYRCTGVCAPSLMTCCRQLLPCDLSGMLPSFSHMPGDLPCVNVMDLAVDAASANVTYKHAKYIEMATRQSASTPSSVVLSCLALLDS